MSDAAYMDAVAKGDMKTAQRMVDAAAKKAGYTVGPVWHGTKGTKKGKFPFTVFDTKRRGKLVTEVGDEITGSFFTEVEKYAKGVALYQTGMSRDGRAVVGRFFLKEPEVIDRGDEGWKYREFVAKEPSQIKSADPVTYDDAGNVIPLSKRFNSQNDDIRNPKRKLKRGLKTKRNPEYSGSHQAPSRDVGAPLHTLKDVYPSDIYGPNAARYYGHYNDARDLPAIRVIQSARGTPDAKVKVFRAVPNSSSIASINPGDWVTTVRGYAVEHGKGALKGSYKILAKVVRADEVFTNGDSIFEFGYDPAVKKNPATSEDLPGPFLRQGSSRDPIPPQRTSPQIKTPAFKKWFAGSVVTTRDGNPRMMYHGTGWTNIREFKSHRGRGQIAGFFAFDPGFASDFAAVFAPDSYNADEEDDSGTRKYATVYPVYLSLKKVFDVRKKEDRDEIEFDGFAKINGWQQPIEGWTWNNLENHSLVRRMKEARFDGYIDFEKGSTSDPTGIAVFNTRNVKSAYGNRGTFDPMDPDIRNPRRSMIRTKLSRIIEPGDRVLDYDRAQGEDLYRLWDLIHTDMGLNAEALTEIEGMLDDDGVLVIQSGEEPAGLRDHFRRATRYQGMLLVQGPMNPEEARINTEKLRRDLE